jgi:hypothetical protein
MVQKQHPLGLCRVCDVTCRWCIPFKCTSCIMVELPTGFKSELKVQLRDADNQGQGSNAGRADMPRGYGFQLLHLLAG